MSPAKIKLGSLNPELKSALLEKQLTWKVADQKSPPFIAEAEILDIRTVSLEENVIDVFAQHTDIAFPLNTDKSSLQPVKDQGKTQACTSFALASAIEDRLRVSNKAKLSISPLFIHHCIAELTLDSPWDLTYAMETDIPHATFALSKSGDAKDLPAQCDTRQGTVHLINITPVSGDQEARNALQEGPIIATMEDWEDFHRFYGGGVYRHASGVGKQLHTIEVVGFDSESWIVKNSWGTSWGEKGFARIAFGECNLFKLAAFSFDPVLT